VAENRRIPIKDTIVDIYGDPLRYAVIDQLTGEAKPDPDSERCDRCSRGVRNLVYAPGTLDVLRQLIDGLPVEVIRRGDSAAMHNWGIEIAKASTGRGDGKDGTVEGKMVVRAGVQELVVAKGDWEWLWGEEGVLRRKLPAKSQNRDTTDWEQDRWIAGMQMLGRDEAVVREQLKPVADTALALEGPGDTED